MYITWYIHVCMYTCKLLITLDASQYFQFECETSDSGEGLSAS